MKTIQCLLDSNNQISLDELTLGRRIANLHKEHLWGDRRAAFIDTIVIHYASAADLDPKRRFDALAVMRIFCDLGVSSHYLIDRKGTVYQLVPEGKKAWHCGGSIMPAPDDRQGVNEFSIGIELIATGVSGFTIKQYSSLGALCADIEKRYGRKMIYLGHQDIAGKRAVDLGLRKDAKTDPGNNLDWGKFKQCLTLQKAKTCKNPLDV
jgi:N-acetyl-anhydromuramyl-L-alanine amidase AmpD